MSINLPLHKRKMLNKKEKKYYLSKLQISKTVNPNSKQEDEDKTATEISPVIPFSLLLDVYENSYIVWGITDKVMSSCNSWFEIWSMNTDGGDANQSDLLKVLETVEIDFLIKNLVICGNAFFEVIRDGTGKVVELLEVLSDQVKLLKGWEWFIQRVGTKTVYFNSFTPLDERPAREKVRQDSKAGAKALIGQKGGAGFNPNLNEIFHFKVKSIKTKYYGDTPFNKVLTQVLLLQNIDKFYMKYFDNYTIKSKIIKSKSGNMTEPQRAMLQEHLKNYMAGIDNAFEMTVINDDIEAVDLGDDLDTKNFLEYREQLEQAVCIGLNLPFDIIKTTNSNRATADAAFEIMNKQLIAPIQKSLIKEIKSIFADYVGVENLTFISVDTKNQKEETDIVATLLDRDVITRHEARKELGYPERDKETLDQFVEWDTPPATTVDGSNNLDTTETDVSKLYKKDDLKKEPDR